MFRSHLGMLLVSAVTISVATAASAQPTDEGLRQVTRVRGASRDVHRLIVEADLLSPTVRRLVDEIQRSDTVVVVQFGFCSGGRFRSCLIGVDGDERQRHIRIVVNTRTTGHRLLATIAHELQHALEIVRKPEIRDAQQALGLYRTIGTGKCQEGLSEACETKYALAIEEIVLEELHRAAAVRRPEPK